MEKIDGQVEAAFGVVELMKKNIHAHTHTKSVAPADCCWFYVAMNSLEKIRAKICSTSHLAFVMNRCDQKDIPPCVSRMCRRINFETPLKHLSSDDKFLLNVGGRRCVISRDVADGSKGCSFNNSLLCGTENCRRFEKGLTIHYHRNCFSACRANQFSCRPQDEY